MRRHQPHGFTPYMWKLPVHESRGDGGVHPLLRRRRYRVPDRVVTVHAVHRPLRTGTNLVGRLRAGVLGHLPVRVGDLHVRNGLAALVGRDVLDASLRIGMPVDGATRRGGRARVHLEDRDRLGIGLVVGVLANQMDPITGDAVGLVAVEAQRRLRARWHLRAWRHGLGD